MPLSDLLNEKNIILSLKAGDRESLIREMVESLTESSYVRSTETVIESILERERLGSTGLNKGIAVPHSRTNEVRTLCVALGISAEGIEFNALDGKKSSLFFMILAPPDQSSAHIRILSEIAGISRNARLLEGLHRALTVEEVLGLFRQ